MIRGPYRNYSSDFKVFIVTNGRKNIASHKAIPRSTIHYWRHHSVGRPKQDADGRFETLSDSEHAAMAMKLEIQHEIAKSLCRTLADLARAGKFQAADLNEIWCELRRSLGDDFLEELGDILPRAVRDKIIGPICKKSDDGGCLKRHPHRISVSEITTMRRLVESKQYAHFSISSLCWYAKREGLVSCNRDTWYRYIHKYGWQRPLRKSKFKKRHTGLRATKPDEYWHIDATNIKLSDGTKLFLQVLVDNFSRRVLAWLLSRRLKATATAALIKEAAKMRRKTKVELISDGGTENVNKAVKATIAVTKPKIIHKIAKVEIPKSNSMVERVFHSLKNQHLYSQRLDTSRDAKRHIKFYINQHNDVIPQAVLSGLTPIEAYKGVDAVDLAAKLEERSLEKRELRLKQNRMNVCDPCKPKKFKDDNESPRKAC